MRSSDLHHPFGDNNLHIGAAEVNTERCTDRSHSTGSGVYLERPCRIMMHIEVRLSLQQLDPAQLIVVNHLNAAVGIEEYSAVVRQLDGLAFTNFGTINYRGWRLIPGYKQRGYHQ